jgi:hypothetical protein
MALRPIFVDMPIKLLTIPVVTAAALFALLFSGASVSAQSAGPDTLWINAGSWVLAQDTMETMRFNASAAFDSTGAVIDRPADEAWSIVIINGDTVDHVFKLSGAAGDVASSWAGVELLAGDTAAVLSPALAKGSYRFFLAGDRARVLGLAGLLRVGYPAPDLGNPEATPDYDRLFNWNLCEWSPERIELVAGSQPQDWDEAYIPKYFTINERGFPETVADPLGAVNLELGQTAVISVANHGYMDQVLHFHGFHVLLMHDSATPQRIGWSKDTVPVRAGHTVTLKLVADQPGTYPVHAHNLIAVTLAGFYPGGMLTQITVTQ